MKKAVVCTLLTGALVFGTLSPSWAIESIPFMEADITYQDIAKVSDEMDPQICAELDKEMKGCSAKEYLAAYATRDPSIKEPVKKKLKITMHGF